jgi:nitrate reductase (cytochrome), electron transfer subunit
MSARALVTVVLLAAGCSSARPSPTPPAAAPIPDTALGLVKGSVFEAPAPPPLRRNESAPGELAVLPRPYALAPPRIPHAIDDFLPITQEQNSCVDCHALAEKKPGDPTPIPASHRVDLRRAPERAGQRTAGARWVCTACHVPRVEVQPLVGSAGG